LDGVRGSTNDLGKINSVDDIVSVMYCMDFLYSKADYQSKLNQVHNNRRNYEYDGEDLATIAKRKAI
jgi:hypothetical protein